jgi:hypothetical protein
MGVWAFTRNASVKMTRGERLPELRGWGGVLGTAKTPEETSTQIRRETRLQENGGLRGCRGGGVFCCHPAVGRAVAELACKGGCGSGEAVGGHLPPRRLRGPGGARPHEAGAAAREGSGARGRGNARVGGFKERDLCTRTRKKRAFVRDTEMR